MPRALGYARYVDEHGRETVLETSTCAHCGRPYFVPKPGEPSGFCHVCFSPVCLECGAKDTCEPFEEKLRRMEARDSFFRSVGI